MLCWGSAAALSWERQVPSRGEVKPWRERMKVASAVVLGTMLLVTACGSAASDGPVNTAEEAVARAKTAWASVSEKASWHVAYSKENTTKFEPYRATLENGVWVVRGTVPSGYRG
jgi:hypothetical protein